MLTSSLCFCMCIQTLALRCTRSVSLHFERNLIFIMKSTRGMAQRLWSPWTRLVAVVSKIFKEVIQVARKFENSAPHISYRGRPPRRAVAGLLSRGDTPRWGLMAGSAACCTTYIRHFPFGCCAATVQRAPSHNRLGVSETTLPAKTQGRTLDCPFNFPPPRVAGWLLMCRCQVCNRAAVALVATGPRRGAL